MDVSSIGDQTGITCREARLREHLLDWIGRSGQFESRNCKKGLCQLKQQRLYLFETILFDTPPEIRGYPGGVSKIGTV
jgi:hypothetical protein